MRKGSRSRARARTKKVAADATDAYTSLYEGDVAAEETRNHSVVIRGPKVSSKNFETAGKERLIPETSVERKRYPLCTGLLDYFPDALAAVSKVSFDATQQHHPDEGLHWDRDKSQDHADCVMRHLTERGGFDGKGNRHSVLLAWRALALAQEELEAEFGFGISRASTKALPSR